ncbi:MAG TPA: hypothetical protein P5228_01290 [Bacteroidales bacterium]|nr:hypothetical protein [Bacteroidales bacterium]HRZ48183.1 hypothetical protein [Bacteroidales bacterium]
MKSRGAGFLFKIWICLVYSSGLQAQGSGVLCISEPFTDTAFPPAGWTAAGVTRVTSAGSFVSAPAAASIGTYNGSLTLPVVSNPVEIQFQLGRTTSTTVKELIVEVGIAGVTGGFVPLDTFDHFNTPDGAFLLCSVNLTGWSAEPAVWIRLRKASATTSPWRIDDVEVYHSPPLPVALTAFKVLPYSQKIAELTWSTAGEWNNAGFVVESSGDGYRFAPIGYVPGNGTTTLPQHYRFSDPLATIPVSYYRLRQQDFDGKEELSAIAECRFSDPRNDPDIESIIIANGVLRIFFRQPQREFLQICIDDIYGRILVSDGVFNPETTEISLNVKLLGGIHVLSVTSTQKTVTRKFFVDF